MLKNLNKIKNHLLRKLAEKRNWWGPWNFVGDLILGCIYFSCFALAIFGIKLFLNWFLALDFLLRLVLLPTLFIFFFFYFRAYLKYEKNFYFQDLLFFLIYIRLIIFLVNFFLTFSPIIFSLIFSFFEQLGSFGYWLFLGICLVFFIFIMIGYKKWRNWSASFRESQLSPLQTSYILSSFEQEYLFKKIASLPEKQYLLFFFKSRFFLLVVLYFLIFSGFSSPLPSYLQFLIFFLLIFLSFFFFYPDLFLGKNTQLEAEFYAFNQSILYWNERLPVHVKKGSCFIDINSFISYRNSVLGWKQPLLPPGMQTRSFGTDWGFSVPESLTKSFKLGKIAQVCSKCVIFIGVTALGLNETGQALLNWNEAIRVKNASMCGPIEHTVYLSEGKLRGFFDSHTITSFSYDLALSENLNNKETFMAVQERMSDKEVFKNYINSLYVKNNLAPPMFFNQEWEKMHTRYLAGIEGNSSRNHSLPIKK